MKNIRLTTDFSHTICNQARTLEWVAISFSNARKWKVKMKSLGCVWLLATPWTAAYHAPPSMEFSMQEYWSGLPLCSPQVNMVQRQITCLNNHLTKFTSCEKDNTDLKLRVKIIATKKWYVCTHTCKYVCICNKGKNDNK